MSEEAIEKHLIEIFAECTGDLLTALGVSHERVSGDRMARENSEDIAAFSGFGNNDLRGSYTLLGSTDLFSRLHPLPPTISPRSLTDWACEVVNQSVGRFHNRMGSYGVVLAIAVPQSALAKELRLSSRLRENRRPITYEVEGMLLEGWLELEMRPGFQLARSPLEEKEPVLKEGAMVIF